MSDEPIGTYEPWQTLAQAQERIAELERENATLSAINEGLLSRVEAVPADAIRAIYDDIPVTNWTRKPLRAIREWLASIGKQVSL